MMFKSCLTFSVLLFFISVSTVNAKNNIINTLPTDKKVVALTFDADMTPYMKKQLDNGKVKSYYNSDVVEILKKEHVPATLFLTGMWAEIYKKEARSLATNPLFEIANHSYSHPGFSSPCWGLAKVSVGQKRLEIIKAQLAITKATGATPTLFRFPGGCRTQPDVDLVSNNNLKVIGWDISSTDAFNKNSTSIYKTVMSKIKNGSIVVFHLHGGANAPTTAPALKRIITSLKKQNYEFTKVGDFVN